MLKLVSRAKLVSTGLVAFSFLMLLTLFLPTGYSADGCTASTTTTRTATGSLTVFTSTVAGSGKTITVSTSTSLDGSVAVCRTDSTETTTIIQDDDVLLGLFIGIVSVLTVGGEILGINFLQVFLPLLSLIAGLSVITIYTVVWKRRKKRA